MDWNTLLSVLLGGILATIPIIISNRFQARELEKDRKEQRREAKTQLALELKKNDIQVLEESIDNYLKGIAELRRIRMRYSHNEQPTTEIVAAVRRRIEEDDSLYKLIHLNMIADKVAYTLGDEFYTEYRNCTHLLKDYLGLMLVATHSGKEKELQSKITNSSGKLHTMLQEKLISLRDT